MDRKIAALIIAISAGPLPAQAVPIASGHLISGFESGLDGWDVLGDVSIQNASIGIDPTQGHQMVFISTMCDRESPPDLVGPLGACQTTTREHPYSGISSPDVSFARAFLGLPIPNYAFNEVLPPQPQSTGNGEAGAIKTKFYAPRSGILSFDWNRIGRDGDSDYFSVWADDATSPFRVNDWLFSWTNRDQFPFSASDVNLCSRYYDGDTPPEPCSPWAQDVWNVETGWQTYSLAIPDPGWYWLGFGMGEIAEGTSPTVLALDNVRFAVVSEPNTLWLLGVALFLLGTVRRDRLVDSVRHPRAMSTRPRF